MNKLLSLYKCQCQDQCIYFVQHIFGDISDY